MHFRQVSITGEALTFMERDALIELTVSADAMTVTGSFLPHSGNARPLSMDYFDSMLDTYDIVHGVRMEEVSEVIFEVNTSHRLREGVVVAQGTPPVAARPAFYRVIEQTARESAPAAGSDSDRVDFKSISRLPVVRKGQVIARRVPERPGIPGTTVRGEEIPPGAIPVETLTPGKNTLIEGEAVFASRGGQLQKKDNQFFVEDRLEITGDVGFSTGSIEFPGDVVLKGEVQDGFHIWAGGSITAANTVDVSQIYCRKDFSANGGLVGRGVALLRCGGRVQAKFVENCQVESKTSIYIKQYCYQARLNSLDRIAMGNRGRVVAGCITASGGVHCYNLGNKAGVATLVRAGINFIVERKLDLCRQKLESVSIRLNGLARALPENPSDDQVDIVHRLEWMRSQLSIQMGDLTGDLDSDENAQIVVDGEVFPGVQVQICRATLNVEQKMARVRFVLDKQTGRVVARDLREEE